MYDIIIPVVITAGVGLFFSVVLVLASKFMAVKEDTRKTEALSCLPGANCGGCGYAGCEGYADALAKGEVTKTNLCAPGGTAVSEKLAEVLDLQAETVDKKTAFVMCRGCENKAEYQGIDTCASAKTVFSAGKTCVYGCLGLGDCLNSCTSNAICMSNGIARINPDICIGCGTCVKACPNGVIGLRPEGTVPAVVCSTLEKGAAVRIKCKNGCISCKKCEKLCPTQAVTVESGVARIDYSRCIDCYKCAEGCPVGCIVKL